MPIIYDDEPQQQPTTQVAGPAMAAPSSNIVYDDQQQASDPYRAAAIKEREWFQKNAPGLLNEGYTRRLGMGAGIGWLDEALAAGSTPFEMIKQRTFNPREAYNYALARERLTSEKARENTPGVLGAGAELLGGAAGFGGAAAGTAIKSIAGAAPKAVQIAGKTVPQWAVNTGKNVGVGAGLGAISGAGEAEKSLLEDPTDIPKHMLTSGAMGGVLGGVLPPAIQAAGSGLGYVTRAVQTPRLFAPQSVADQRVLQIANDAGVSPQEIVRRVTDAHASGQTGYTVADAIGNEGARALTAQAKTPGAQREAIVKTLTDRAAGRRERVVADVGDALGVQGTAAQAEAALLERARTQSRPFYQEADQHPTWSNRLQEFLDDPIAQRGLARGRYLNRVDAVGNPNAPRQFDRVVTDFDAAGNNVSTNVDTMSTLNTLKIGLDDMIARRVRQFGRNDREVGVLTGYKNRMLAEMDALNPAYREARANFSEPMRISNAVDTGRDLTASAARYQDTVPQIVRETLPEAERQGLRIGYADKVFAPYEAGGNFPTLLTSKSAKGRAELDALSRIEGPVQPGQPSPLRRYLNREEAMIENERKALGGSPTAENLADMAAGDAALGDAVAGTTRDLMTGNKLGLAMRAWNQFTKYAQGNSEAQRMAITRALLESDPTAAQAMAQRLAIREAKARDVATRNMSTPYWSRMLGGRVNVP
jgi:hypothetical protein